MKNEKKERQIDKQTQTAGWTDRQKEEHGPVKM